MRTGSPCSRIDVPAAASARRRSYMGGMSWCFGAYELDLARRELRVAGEPRPLQPQVFAVLAYLVRNRHRVGPKEEILRELRSH